jgi:hypothetical protein
MKKDKEPGNGKLYKFDAVIRKLPDMDACLIDFPYDVEKAFGTKGQVKVKAWFDGELYRGSLVRMGQSCHWIGITKAIRSKIGKGPGERIAVEIERDVEERSVEIPGELLEFLKTDRRLSQVFEKLSYTNRKEIAKLISEAKRPETRERRLRQVIERLEGLAKK